MPVVGGQRGESYVSTTFRKIALVGKVETTGPIEVEVINNNRQPVKPAIHDGYFHSNIILSLGSNLIEVRWRKKGDGAWKTKVASIFRSSRSRARYRAITPRIYSTWPKTRRNARHATR